MRFKNQSWKPGWQQFEKYLKVLWVFQTIWTEHRKVTECASSEWRCGGCRLSERSESTLPLCQIPVSEITPHALNILELLVWRTSFGLPCELLPGTSDDDRCICSSRVATEESHFAVLGIGQQPNLPATWPGVPPAVSFQPLWSDLVSTLNYILNC